MEPFHAKGPILNHYIVLFLAIFTLFTTPTAADGLLCTNYDVISTTQTIGSARYTTIKDNLAYVSTSSPSGLEIYDIQNPRSPKLLSRSESPWVNKLHIAGDYAFSATSSRNLAVFNIADPANPFLVDYVRFDEWIEDIATDGDNLFILFFELGLNIYDISGAPPENYDIQHTAHYEPANFTPSELAAHGNKVYLVSETELRILDTSDAFNPVPLGTLQTTFKNGPYGIKLFDQTIVIKASDPRFISIDVSDPQNPTQTTVIENDSLPSSNGFHFTENRFYQSGHSDGLAVYDISNLADINQLGFLRLPSNGSSFQLDTDPNHPGLGYISNLGSGLTLVDLNTVPAQPPIIQTVPTESVAGHDTADDLLAVVTVIHPDSNWYYDLNLYNAPDLLNPELLSTTRLSNSTANIQLAGNIAYMLTRDQNWGTDLHLYSIADQSNPVPVAIYNLESSIREYLIVDSIAYLATNDELQVVDFSNPSTPVLLGSHPLPQNPNQIILEGSTLFLAGTGLLSSYDVSDPTNPALIYQGSLPGGSATIDVQGQYAYVSWWGPENPSASGEYETGFKIIDISNPKNPTLLTYFHDSGLSCEALTIIDNTLYCANRWGGISIYDVTDPLAPSKITSYGSLGNPDGIEVNIKNQTAKIQGNRISILDLSNDCGPCPNDYTNDGIINSSDIFAFINLFKQQDPIADRTFDGHWDFYDISSFLTDIAQGCP